MIKSILSQIPSLLAAAALIGLVAVGHQHDWQMPQHSAISKRALPARANPSSKDHGPPGASAADGATRRQASLSSSAMLDSGEFALASNIELAQVMSRPMTEEITAPGIVGYDQTRVAQLTSRVSGTVWSVQKHVGQAVHKGEILAVIEALDVGRSKTDFLKAVVDYELKAKTLKRMHDASSAIPERKIREAEADARAARIVLYNAQQTLANLGLPVRLQEVAGLYDEELVRRVRFLGLPQSLIRSVDPTTTTANLIPLTAPFDGIITDREIVIGESVAPASGAHIVMADVNRMWVELDVRREDAAKLHRGQEVTFTVNGISQEIRGELSWISTEVDSRTHNVKARMTVDNPPAVEGDTRPEGQRLLRANMLGAATIQVHANPEAMVVPNLAVQQDGSSSVVFVKTAESGFQPRVVELGMSDGNYIEVLEGVSLGDTVATTGSHVLTAESLDTRLADSGRF
ncbi:MAG TPA: efflux RND transporter periplasmic adaptor subunit [Pirellulales bacterium]|nr:efflux RND transporter periplasmic adaptor subunit [Pirellulales bacterium]